jgi:hypothetical protein
MTIHFEGQVRFSKQGPRNCRSLGFARDDKGKGNGFVESGCRTEGFLITLDKPETQNNSGRDDKSTLREHASIMKLGGKLNQSRSLRCGHEAKARCPKNRRVI